MNFLAATSDKVALGHVLASPEFTDLSPMIAESLGMAYLL